jgi:peptidoglycan/xylan/chitin deacetylase (PgdA/CDA1 family)
MDSTTHLTHAILAEGDTNSITVLRYRLTPWAVVPAARNGAHTPEDALRKHLELLDRWGFTLITLSDCRLFLRGEIHLPRKPVVLTFDDGPPDLYRKLLSVFHEFGGRAVVFVMSGFAQREDESAKSPLEAYREGLRALVESGIEIGSLTCTGRPLTSLPPELAAHELSESKALLEDILEAPVYSCAYPHNTVTPEIKKMVIKAGYDFAVGGEDAPAIFGTDLYEIGRRGVTSTMGPLRLAVKVFGPGDRIKRIRHKSLARLGPVPEDIKIPVNS